MVISTVPFTGDPSDELTGTMTLNYHEDDYGGAEITDISGPWRSLYVGWDSSYDIWSPFAVVLSGGPQGSQGSQGNQGSQGAQGSQGNQGAQGDQGNQGTQGEQGYQGYRGYQGNQGTQTSNKFVCEEFKSLVELQKVQTEGVSVKLIDDRELLVTFSVEEDPTPWSEERVAAFLRRAAKETLRKQE